MKRKEFLTLLADQFPSKYMKKKAADHEDSDYEDTDDEEEEEEEEEEEGEEEEESFDSDYETIDSVEENGKNIVNIILSSGVSDSECSDDSDYEDEEESEKDKPYKEFIALMKKKHFDSKKESKYFKALQAEEKTLVLEKLRELDTSAGSVPPRIAILQAKIPVCYKKTALEKINALKKATGGELHKLNQWLSGFLTIPLGKYIDLPVNFSSDGVEKCQEFMRAAKITLDKSTYGLQDAKSQILQWLGKAISNRTCTGTVIGIHGPMGTGKTTLLKSVSEILGNRPFHLIPMGGATDSSYFEGHMITYEGSVWGHIVECLRRGDCMNPVFFFDELDKVSDTPKGDEILGILTHLTDPSQNNKFVDKFFSIELDLSRAIFVFSYNNKAKVEGTPLGDRMFKIETAGYTIQEKLTIAENYLIPSIFADINFKEGEVHFPRETIVMIAEHYTSEEKGVRNLKRCLEIIASKLNLYRIMQGDMKDITGDVHLEVTFPYTVDTKTVSVFLKMAKTNSYNHMYC